MTRPAWASCALIAALALPATVHASDLSVDLWTNRGNEAVYETGDQLQIGVRANDDSHLLVYEIDAEGYVTLLFPYGTSRDFVEAKQTYRIPDNDSDMDLVVEGPVGEGYIVAIASRDPFDPLPWYLRPYNAQAAELGYAGEPEEEEGVTNEGRIVGDPFVAMERIRRRVVHDHDNSDVFATAYTTYYLHEPVKYPRYLCYDCHRPGYWSWWDGFDPYYATCSRFTFHVNYSWTWGPNYWFSYTPYYVYSCLPGYGWRGRRWYCGWDGWGYWSSIWGGPLRRHKSPPPPNYVPPERYKKGTPPGLIADHRYRRGEGLVPIGHNGRPRWQPNEPGNTTQVDRGQRSGPTRQPAGEVRPGEDSRRSGNDRGGVRRAPAGEVRRGDDNRGRPTLQPRPAREPARGGEDHRPQARPVPARQPRPEPAKPPKEDPAPKPDDSGAQPAPAPKPDPAHPSRGKDPGKGRGNRIEDAGGMSWSRVPSSGRAESPRVLRFTSKPAVGSATGRNGSRGSAVTRGAVLRSGRSTVSRSRNVARSGARVQSSRRAAPKQEARVAKPSGTKRGQESRASSRGGSSSHGSRSSSGGRSGGRR